ncbi:MAG: ATP-binding protein [Granulosicoccus sp.]
MKTAIKIQEQLPEESVASLSTFFSQTPQTEINPCHREQVRLLGAVQCEGAMLIVCQSALSIVAYSRNMLDILGIGHVDILDTSLSDFDKDWIEALTAELSELDPDQIGVHSVLDVQIMNKSTVFDVVVHGYQARWVIELMPASHLDVHDVRRGMRVISRECDRILSSTTLDESLQIACNATRDITGFSRVKIYQYLPDWSVRVVAESREEHMPSFLGLHFPDTDISRQARALFNSVPYCAIFSAHGETHDILQYSQNNEVPPDLNYSLLRSVSSMHTCYLQNMEVEASFSISLFLDGKPWGLIVCHHDESRALPFDLWTSLRELGLALSNRIAHDVKRIASKRVLDLRKMEINLASDLRQKGKLMDVVDEFGPSLMKFMDADGFAFQYGDEIHLTGHTPPREFIPELIEWVRAEADEREQYQTCSLHRHWPEAEQHRDSACGVLLQPIALHRTCQMIWFRRPLAENIDWAEEVTAKFNAEGHDGTAALMSRNSLAGWIGEHNDFSQAWTDAELIIAREIVREFLDILVSVLIRAEESSRLKSFAASAAAHDIKAPLRQIEMALNVMEEDKFDADTMREWHDLAKDSTRILKNFTAGILDYMSVPDAAQAFAPTDLAEIFSDIQKVTKTQVAHDDATILIDISHHVIGEKSLITSLFLNLICNALNYTANNKHAVIRVDSIDVDNQWIEISVSDNGIGIPVKYADQVFKPSVRLNKKKDVEGSGLGLSICRRIVNIHEGSIHVDTNYTDGARFVVRLPKANILESGHQGIKCSGTISILNGMLACDPA